MYFSIKDEKFSKECDEIREKVSNIIQQDCNIEPVQNEKYLKAEKKSTQKRAFNIILINSVYRKDENYYPKVFFRKI